MIAKALLRLLSKLYRFLNITRYRDVKHRHRIDDPYGIFYDLAVEYIETNPEKLTMDSFLKFYCKKGKYERLKYETAVLYNENFPFREELIWYWNTRVKSKYPNIWEYPNQE